MYAIGLQRDGWQVEIAPTAEEGLRQALSSPPDLLLLDIMLPGMDGVEMLSRLRSNPKTQNLPVLVLSNSPGLSGKLQRARSLGILGWLTKSSITPRELASEIRPFLK
jgi:putative two-component system response regulator